MTRTACWATKRNWGSASRWSHEAPRAWRPTNDTSRSTCLSRTDRVRGKDVFVPLDALIGGVDMAGQGWRMLVECLSVGRAITLPATSTGGSKMSARATGAYARIRKQFNMPIGRFEGIEAALARIAANAYATSRPCPA